MQNFGLSPTIPLPAQDIFLIIIHFLCVPTLSQRDQAPTSLPPRPSHSNSNLGTPSAVPTTGVNCAYSSAARHATCKKSTSRGSDVTTARTTYIGSKILSTNVATNSKNATRSRAAKKAICFVTAPPSFFPTSHVPESCAMSPPYGAAYRRRARYLPVLSSII